MNRENGDDSLDDKAMHASAGREAFFADQPRAVAVFRIRESTFSRDTSALASPI